jgi:hypothetical protein
LSRWLPGEQLEHVYRATGNIFTGQEYKPDVANPGTVTLTTSCGKLVGLEKADRQARKKATLKEIPTA